jgi:hypothetical protein
MGSMAHACSPMLDSANIGSVAYRCAYMGHTVLLSGRGTFVSGNRLFSVDEIVKAFHYIYILASFIPNYCADLDCKAFAKHN